MRNTSVVAHAEELDRRECREGGRQRVAHPAVGKIELTSSLGIELAYRALAQVAAALSAHGVELLGPRRWARPWARGSVGGAIEAVGKTLEHHPREAAHGAPQRREHRWKEVACGRAAGRELLDGAERRAGAH
jgi:hypothetical protein